MITDGDFKGHHISVKRQIVSEEGEVVTIKVVTPFSERKTCVTISLIHITNWTLTAIIWQHSTGFSF